MRTSFLLIGLLIAGCGPRERAAEPPPATRPAAQEALRFSSVSEEAGLGHTPPTEPIVGRAVATADYDRDGDVDLLLTENGGPVHLLRNDQDGGRALRVRLEGRTGPRDALGAHVYADAEGME